MAQGLVLHYFKQGEATSISEEDAASVEGFCNYIASLHEHSLKVEDGDEVDLYLTSDGSKYVSKHNLIVYAGGICTHDLCICN